MARSPQPIDRVVWSHRDNLHPNSYNPNAVAPPELELLKISILEDGWTQPIVVDGNRQIVDGYHRWLVSGHLEVYSLTGGEVPTVTIHPNDNTSAMMATIRHNRARGTHAVLKMAYIVKQMVQEGLSKQEIMSRLQMEEEEVIRLALRVGIPKTKIIDKHNWSKSWSPK
jgi:ParB-like chromosome segregation protein Spo0J